MKRARRRLLTALAALPFLPWQRAFAATRPLHHAADGTFTNTNGEAISKSLRELLKWRRERPSVAPVSFPLAQNNPAWLRANRSVPTLTWIGHATFLLQLGGVNILTDPHFSERASPFSFAGPKRSTAPGLALADLPPIDVVLISHNHYDHLDGASIAALAAQHQPAFVVPLKLAAEVSAMGTRSVHELDWGESLDRGGVRLTAEPCHHWSARGMFDRNETLWASYAVTYADFRFLFIGDTGYSADFAALGEKYDGFDWAAIPIGAYAPRWFMSAAHINPQEAVQVFQDLRAANAVATHWGVFPLTNEPLDEPPRKLQQALAAADVSGKYFSAWQHGESRALVSGEVLQ